MSPGSKRFADVARDLDVAPNLNSAATGEDLAELLDGGVVAPTFRSDPVARIIAEGLPRGEEGALTFELDELLFSKSGKEFGTAQNPDSR